MSKERERLVRYYERLIIVCPHSEVCKAVRVAGKRMLAELQPSVGWEAQVQLYSLDGVPFGAPLLPGDAGFTTLYNAYTTHPEERAMFFGYEMISDIAYLSSGTIAGLCGSGRYDDIDAYSAGWQEWVNEQPRGTRWASWQDCHADYESYLRSCAPVGQYDTPVPYEG